MTELEKQVEREKAELDAAPVIPAGNAVQRCHFCGQLTTSATVVESIAGVERLRGACCGG